MYETNPPAAYWREQIFEWGPRVIFAILILVATHFVAKAVQWGVAKAIVGVEERAQDSPVSIVGGGRLAGETVAHEEFPVLEKTIFLLMLIAGFNFFIGMFNFCLLYTSTSPRD